MLSTRHLLYSPNFHTAIGASLCTLSVLDGVICSPSSVLLTPLLPAVPLQLSVAHALRHHFENLQLFSVFHALWKWITRRPYQLLSLFKFPKRFLSTLKEQKEIH